MNEKIIFIADMAHFKTYRARLNAATSKYSMELIASIDNIDGRERMGETLSDRAGRFTTSSSPGARAGGSGEPHRMLAEKKKRITRTISGYINSILKERAGCSWYLAAPKKINANIVDHIEKRFGATMKMNVLNDLTKYDGTRLLDRFSL